MYKTESSAFDQNSPSISLVYYVSVDQFTLGFIALECEKCYKGVKSDNFWLLKCQNSGLLENRLTLL